MGFVPESARVHACAKSSYFVRQDFVLSTDLDECMMNDKDCSCIPMRP